MRRSTSGIYTVVPSPKRRGSGRFGGQEGAPASKQWGGARGRARPGGSTGRSGELAEAGGCASTGDSTGKRSGVAVGVEAGASDGQVQSGAAG